MMSSPLLGVVEGGGHVNTSSFHKNLGLTERNYLGLSDCSSVDSCSNVSSISEVNKNTSLLLKATELRLGLPGSQSPDRDPECSSDKLDEKPLFPLLPTIDGICSSSPKTVVSGHKRVFTDTMDSGSEVKGVPEGNWIFGSSGVESDASKSLVQGKCSNVNGMISSGTQPVTIKGTANVIVGSNLNKTNSSSPPAAK